MSSFFIVILFTLVKSVNCFTILSAMDFNLKQFLCVKEVQNYIKIAIIILKNGFH
jgi:hypothetical protein